MRGARDRRNYGDLGEATVGCREGLVCTPVEFGRSECRLENAESKHTYPQLMSCISAITALPVYCSQKCASLVTIR